MPEIYGTSGDDDLPGTGGDDTIYGLAGNDTLNGGDGADTLNGGDGDDVLTGGLGIDQLNGGAGADIFRDTLSGFNGDTITDFSGSDTLVFTDAVWGYNTFLWWIDGSTFHYNTYTGFIGSLSLGNFEASSNSTTGPAPGGGVQVRIQALPPPVHFTGTDGDDTITGTYDRDIVDAGAGNDHITTYEGADVVNAGTGNDYVDGGDGDDSINGDDGDDTLIGGRGVDIVHGGAGDDTIIVSIGNGDHAPGDQYFGDDGVDTLLFQYPFSGALSPIDLTTTQISGIEILRSDVPLILTSAQLQQFSSFTGFITLANSGTIDLSNHDFESGRLTLASGDNVLTLAGGTTHTYGYREIISGDGNDRITGSSADDSISGGNGNDYIDGGPGADSLQGGAGDDVMIGGDGNDSFWDDAGTDIMDGGDGGDRFFANFLSFSSADKVFGGAGYDALTIDGFYQTGLPYLTLANITGIESLTALYGRFQMTTEEANAFSILKIGSVKLTTAGSVSNGLNVQINDFELSDFGNSVSLGAGTMFEVHRVTGGAGNDVVFGGGGQDTISGGGGNDEIHGGDQSDTLSGGSGVNWVDGGAGDDLLVLTSNATLASGDHYTGGSGYDTLSVDNSLPSNIVDISAATIDSDIEKLVGSTIILTADQANIFQAFQISNQLRITTAGTVNFTGRSFQGSNIYLSDFGNTVIATEQVPNPGLHVFGGAGNDTIVGAGANDELVGGGGNDILTGGGGDDRLDGGTGADLMTGGSGNDTYTIDNVGDIVVEVAGQGYDTIYTSVSLTLASANDIEEANLTGSASLNLTGNELANKLTGNGGDNVLDGGAGADVLNGGSGNDTYVVDNVGDIVNETAGGGIDTVLSSVSFALSPFVDNLTLTGSSAIDGIGSNDANVLRGNDAANTLAGLLGNDTLIGGGGADRLIGGEGSDTFLGTKADLNGDTILDLSPGDRIVISDATLADFSFNLTGRTLAYNGGSLTLGGSVPARIVASTAPEGGVQLVGIPDGLLQAFTPFDLGSLNLNWYYQFGTATSLQKNVNTVLDGQIYADAFGVQASDGGPARELDFLGSGLVRNAQGAITGGTVNVVGEFDLTFHTFLWYVEGVSIDAGALYNAALTPSNQDELNLIGTALSGNNIIILSQFDDKMNGFAGDDVITGGGGSDVLTGGGGNDTFKDATYNLGGDTITDFDLGDKIIVTDADISNFSFNLSGTRLQFSGGVMTLSAPIAGHLVARAAITGGVELTIATEPTHNDFNGDLRSDLLWRSADGSMADWVAKPGGFAGAWGTLVPLEWTIAGTGDFNGDGRSDILWRNQTGAMANWSGATNGGFTPVWGTTVSTDWHIVGAGDFNGDGKGDILWRNDNGAMADWLGAANGGFTPSWGTTVSSDWHVESTGDFNGDGRVDILWRSDGGAVADWLGAANGGFVATWGTLVPLDWQIIGTGDFNGDGHADILWRNDGGSLVNWLGSADGAFTPAFATAAPSGLQVASIGDFNGDGRDDILWRDSTSTLVEWLGQASGAIIANPNFALSEPTGWHVQDPLL